MQAKIYSVEEIKLATLKTNPPILYIRARGVVPTSGWTNPGLVEWLYIQPPPDGIWDFDFVAEPPSGIVLQVLTRIVVEHLWKGDLKTLKGVRIHASTNDKVELLGKPVEYPSVNVGDLFTRAVGALGTDPFPW